MSPEMSKEGLVVVFDGNIGSGKTSLIDALSARLPHATPFLEPVDDWSAYLGRAYADPERHTFAMNLRALLSVSKWGARFPPDRIALCERSTLSCNQIFCKMHVAKGLVHPLDAALLDEVNDSVGWKPDLIFYLRTDPATCESRMRARGRTCERDVSRAYIDALHNAYEDLYAGKSECGGCPVVQVDSGEGRQEVERAVLAALERFAVCG